MLNKNGYDEDCRSEQDDENDGLLTATESKAFRMLAARLNYMAQDHVWLQFSAKEICRSVANPKANDFLKIKGAVPDGYRRGQVQVQVADGRGGP